MTYNNQQVLRFLHRVRKGLPKAAVMRIAGLKSANEYYREGKIRKSEIPHFKKVINEEVSSHQKTLTSIAKAYAGNKRRGRNSIEPSVLLDIYFKTKHGFKVIHATPTAQKIWTFDKSDMHMLTHIKKWRWGRKMLQLTKFLKFTPENVGMLVERINEWSDLMGKIAELQRKAMEDPYLFVPDIRAIKTEEMLKTVAKPRRNDVCLCGSGLKYKKCCGTRLA